MHILAQCMILIIGHPFMVITVSGYFVKVLSGPVSGYLVVDLKWSLPIFLLSLI